MKEIIAVVNDKKREDLKTKIRDFIINSVVGKL